MSRAEFTEEQLKAAVTAYAEALLEAQEIESCEIPEHEFSEHYNARKQENIELARKMETAKRKKASRRRFWRRAAAVFAGIILAFSAAMAFSPEARAAVSSWTISTYDKIVHYQFNRAEDNHAFIICSPGSLPAGFERTEKYRNEYYSRNVYKNAETGEYIKFEYFKPTEKQIARIEKTGQDAELYYVFDYYEMYYTRSAGKHKVCWYNQDRNLAFYAESNTEKEVLINTFNTVDYRLPRFEATWVPEGLELSEYSDYLFELYYTYSDCNGDPMLLLNCMDMAEVDLIEIFKGVGEDTDTIVWEDIIIKNYKAKYYPPSEHDMGSEIVWIDEKEKLVFWIAGVLDREDIIHFAESVVCTETEW